MGNMFKTTTAKTPEEYLGMIEEPRKTDMIEVFNFLKEAIPDEKPFIDFGMIAFRRFHYKSKSGREGDWAVILLASQKNYISVYVCAADGKEYVAERYADKLGKVSVGKSCIRFKKLDDVNKDVLKKVVQEGVKMGGMGYGV
jgi:hypothetical protein